jgi:hypothetical protein
MTPLFKVWREGSAACVHGYRLLNMARGCGTPSDSRIIFRESHHGTCLASLVAYAIVSFNPNKIS